MTAAPDIDWREVFRYGPMEREVWCSPELEEPLLLALRQADIPAGFKVEVKASDLVPPGQVFIIDPRAIKRVAL